MKISEVKLNHPEILTGEEYLDIQEIKELFQRLIDIEKEIENIKNQLK